jgi:phosphatidylserine/phosphatidylglycerophosphate/cardiolipin synthase-like enzyme
MPALDIYAQADVVTARLRIAPLSAAGNLETTLMEAIRAGANTPHDLADIFGLAPRLVLQVLGDLWRAGRVSVEMQTSYETLSVTTAGLRELEGVTDDGTLGTTATTATSEDVVIERLTGRALPTSASMRRVAYEDRDMIVPATADDRPVSSVSEAELVSALSAGNFGGEADEIGTQRVISAFLQPDMLQVASRRRYVKLRAAAQITATDELTVAVVDDLLSLSERANATRRLQGMVDAQPLSSFAQRLRARATHVPLQAGGVDQVLDELRRHLTTMDACPWDERQQRHDRAAALVNQVAAYAQTRSANEMEVRIVSTTEQHWEVITDLINRAQRQVVIAVPWIRAKGLESARAPLLSALGRGVQVVLVWGIDGHAEGLAGPESGWLDSITAHVYRTGTPGRLIYSRSRSARSHAKLVISDDREMLVTSKNFLSRSNHTEVGVLLSAIGNQESPVIEAGLQYIYDKAPDPRIAFALHRLPGAFGPRDSAPNLRIQIPRLQPALLQEEAPAAFVRVWAAAWSDASEWVQKLLDRPRPTIETVTDLEHRGVVREAVAGAKSRVLIASDKVTETALSQDIASQLIERAAEGVDVTLRYRDAPFGDVPGINDLRAASGTTLNVAHTPSMHAKVVLHDDRSLIGSFNPLSVDANLRKRRSTGEFGVAIDSSAVADAVWTVVTGSPAPLNRQKATDAVTAEPSPANLAQSLLEAGADSSNGPLFALVAEHGFSALLDAWRTFGGELVADVRLAGAGLAVALKEQLDPSPAVTLALDGLMRTGNWGVASLLRPLVPNPHHRPRNCFTLALREGSKSGQALFTALTSGDEFDSAELDALIVADYVHLLLDDNLNSEADSELLFSAPVPSARVEGFVAAAAAYLRRYGPLATTAPARTNMFGTDLPGLWRAAEEACAAFARYDAQSGVGNRLMKHLIDSDGELALLHVALASRDPLAVARWRDEFLQPVDDGKWLDRAVRGPGLPNITDSRRRSFTAHRRKVRLAVAELCSRLEGLESAEAFAWSSEQLGALEELIQQSQKLAGLADQQTPEGGVIVAETRRVLAWSEGAVRPPTARDWRGWAFVQTYLASAAAAEADVPLEAVARDLAADLSFNDAVGELARAGEYEQARRVIEQVAPEGTLERDELTRTVGRHIAEAQDRVTEQLHTLDLACERAGIPAERQGLLDVRPRRCVVEAKLTELVATAEAEIDVRRIHLSARLASTTDLAPGWKDYVQTLIEAGELVLAERALTHRDGVQELPRPKPFFRWSWRDRSAQEIATWFAGAATAPAGVGTRFAPHPDDRAGRAVMEALAALGDNLPNAPQQWVLAVQQLLAPDDEYYRPQFTIADERLVATFRLPYDQRLPLLRWARSDAVTVAIGDAPVPEALLRFPLAATTSAASEALVEISDVLSLIALSDTDRTPTPTERALQFLAVVCSRLDLADIIEPQDMPAGATESARHRLAWLLSILGMSADGRDVDRLSVWSGGHRGVLWSLVNEARKDPARPAGSVIELPDLDALLLHGVEVDLEHDEDILVLGLGLAGGHLVEGCSEAELAALFEDEWRESGRNPDHRVRVSEVVRRLKERAYLGEEGGLLYSCGCLTARAVERVATQEWLAARMNLVDTERFIHQAAYELILEMIRHQEQAEGARLSDAEIADRARQRLAGRLTDNTAFDLVRLCDMVRREYSNPDVDVFCKFANEPLWVQDAGPSIWIECLAYELLNNAIAATSGLPPGQATVWLTIERDPQHECFALLSVRNNGKRLTQEIQDAFRMGRRVHDPARPRNGTGLYRFKTFGESRGVEISLGETDTRETIVRCRVPLAGATE